MSAPGRPEEGRGWLRELLHVGVVVEDLEAACRAFERLAGAPAGDRWESAVGVRVAFFEVGGSRVELVQYTGPIVERFGPTLARREGVHHLCYRVDDLESALATARARGLAMVP
jgi:catechol 2,3-dioxygenase-like lactoylglutathione lyase family enzyme